MESAFKERLADFESEGRLRHIPTHRKDGRFTDLTLNDYMGLAQRNGEWVNEFRERFGNVAMTAVASRLLASDQNIFGKLEDYLAREYGKAALMFNSGYHANVGLVSALNLPDTLWATDKLIHASVIDGIRMAGADCRRWNHNDTEQLERIVEKGLQTHRRVVVVCESIYSMDGDEAPLAEIVEIKRRHPGVMFYVDEAHAIGVRGRHGLGVCAELDITDDVDILVGTLGKACASAGAFAVCSPTMREYLVNTARSLIFSTAIAPANAAWSLLMLEKLAGMDAERKHLGKISARFREGIERITGEPNPSTSAIVPLLTGNSARAVEISRLLEKDGVLALPIRRPTVPPGGERIRFSLNANLTETDVDTILGKIEYAYNAAK